jgi:hypothetical protein
LSEGSGNAGEKGPESFRGRIDAAIEEPDNIQSEERTMADRVNKLGVSVAIGAAVGLALGVALGHLPFWLAFGCGAGIGIGILLKRIQRR